MRVTASDASLGVGGVSLLSLSRQGSIPRSWLLRTYVHQGLLPDSIFSLRESGILSKLLSEVLFNSTECAKPITSTVATSSQRPLELLDFLGVFLLYAVGE